MKRIIIILLVQCLIVPISYGQLFHRKEGQKKLLILSPGASYQGQFCGELNLMLSSITSVPHVIFILHGPRIGIETNFKGNQFVYAPKIAYEFNANFLCCRGSVISYIDKGQPDVRILPELGLSFLGAANLTYGYSIPTLSFQTTETSRHRLSLIFNLDIGLWKDLCYGL